jgi:hypothetical protein
MEMQRPKSRKKKIIVPVEQITVNNVQEETENLVVEQVEELGSWEDLHAQVSDLDKLYPSAPAGPVLEFEEPSQTVSFPQPLLTMVKEELQQPVLSQTTTIMQPSAPEFPEDHLDLVVNASAPTFKASLNWNPLPVDVLEKIYVNPVESEYSTNVANFRNSLNSSNHENAFYRKLREYQLSFMELEEMERKVFSDIRSVQALSSKYWSLERDPITIKDYCPDGWTISHTFINEKPVLHSEVESRLENAFHEIKKTVYIDRVRLSYNSKVISKIIIVFQKLDSKLLE